jgi:hypothetical protein
MMQWSSYRQPSPTPLMSSREQRMAERGHVQGVHRGEGNGLREPPANRLDMTNQLARTQAAGPAGPAGESGLATG